MSELSANASKIMELVKQLTIVELNDLVKSMEEEFGVSAAAPIMMAWAVWANTWEDEKTSFDVILKSAGAWKIWVIKVIREITGLGLKEGKDIADNGWEVKKAVSKDEANDIKAKLEAAWATVEIK